MINKIRTLPPIFKATGAILAILITINLIGSNLLATQGQELDSIYQQTLSLQKENAQLSNQVAALSSLHYLQQITAQLGYQPISRPVALATPAPVALAPNTTAIR